MLSNNQIFQHIEFFVEDAVKLDKADIYEIWYSWTVRLSNDLHFCKIKFMNKL